MGGLDFSSYLMRNVTAYRLSQVAYAERKLDPVRRHNDLRQAHRVLDVGCGPGTNTRHFAHAHYVGVDHNRRYLVYARRRHGREFVVADIARGLPLRAAGFDFVLVNSLLHHLDLASTRRVLSDLRRLVTDDGHVHVLDLVRPDVAGVARALARWDRGPFARRLEEWHTLLCEAFDPVVFEPYRLTTLGVVLWNMVYFKGRRRS